MIQETIGIAMGLGAAFCYALSYLFTRRFLSRYPGGILSLMAFSHILMGLASLAMLPFLWPGWAALGPGVWRALAGAVGFYLVGQVAFFFLLRHIESSRVASLLGLKIVVLALIVSLWQGQALGWMRWGAVAMSVGAAFLLNEAGGRLPGSAVAWLGVTVTGYALSDISITALMRELRPAGAAAPFLGVALTYALCGIVCAPLLWATGRGTRAEWACAGPCAAAWFTAMLFLYVCFGAIGVVFGNIIQSTRGLMAVGLGVVVARLGWTHLEGHVSRPVFWKRAAGALLMLGAIALYVV